LRHCATAADGRQRYQCTNGRCEGWHGTQPIGLVDYRAGIDTENADRLARTAREARGIRRYVITAAQNATPVYEPFLNTLKGYCRHNNAQLLVIPYRYKNPTSRWSDKAAADDWWAPELAKVLIDVRTRLNPNLLLLADIKTQPTANNPLEGLETISGALSAIVGHPKIEAISVPTPHKKMPKMLVTTGAVTRPNYIPSKAGKKGEFHHTYGAIVVEIEGPLFFMRHLNAVRDGSFCDLNYEYRGGGRRRQRLKGLVMGDWHDRFTDPAVRRATFEDKDSIANVLDPEYVVWHDFNDQDSRNHHDKDDPFLNVVKDQHGLDAVEGELDASFGSVDRYHRPGRINVFPYSNHPNQHLERWVKENDWRRDPVNAAFYLRTALAMVEGAHWTPNGAKTVDPMIYWAERKLKCFKDCRFLGPDDSLTVAGVELAMHGHLGPNGARGSIRAFGRIGVRSMIGHGHGPGIRDGVMQVGTSSYCALATTRDRARGCTRTAPCTRTASAASSSSSTGGGAHEMVETLDEALHTVKAILG
jgi:hypothetical protein